MCQTVTILKIQSCPEGAAGAQEMEMREEILLLAVNPAGLFVSPQTALPIQEIHYHSEAEKVRAHRPSDNGTQGKEEGSSSGSRRAPGKPGFGELGFGAGLGSSPASDSSYLCDLGQEIETSLIRCPHPHRGPSRLGY